MKIYDTFCFFNEYDILDLRLNILNDVVDYFVICESSVTHTGIRKPFNFELNKDKYSKFLKKIIYLKINDTPNNYVNLPIIKDITTFDGGCLSDINKFIVEQKTAFDRNTQINYGRDFYQKECVRRGLFKCNDDDVIIFSDCDEIPNPEVIKNVDKLIHQSKFLMLNQNTYYYYLNILKETQWKGSRIGLFKDLKNYSYNKLRADNQFNIDNGGWHFSFMGGEEKVKTKINAYSAQDLSNSHVMNSIKHNMENNIDPFFRGTLSKVEIDNTYPKYLLENIEKYKHLLKN